MKEYYSFRVIMLFLIAFGLISVVFKRSKSVVYSENYVENVTALSQSDVVDMPVVYEGLTLAQLADKIDNKLNSTLDGYGLTIASLALEYEVDPVMASAIILLETGCTWSCSSLVNNNNNVGGMVGNGGYAKFDSLEAGIEAFIKNLANNYYKYGLNTPELINTKYASNPLWYQKVYYYMEAIMES